MKALPRYLPAGLVALAAIYVLAFAVLAAARVGYVHELEWEEGYSLQHVQRLAAGERLYVAPSLDFVPFPYPPLYFLASAAVARVWGEGFEPLRLVSILSTAASLVLLFAWARRETGKAWCGAVAAGLFAASYGLSDAWFDVARVDALFLALTLAAMGAVRFGSGVAHQAAGGALFAAAFLTKQTALFFALPLCAVALRLHGRPALASAAVFAAIVGVTTWLGSRATDGWYAFYVLEMLGRHEIVREVLGRFDVQTNPRSLHLWVTLPEPLRTDECVAQARQRGVWVAGAEAFTVGRDVPHAVRVSIAAVRDRVELRRGLEVLAEILDGYADPYAQIL